MNKLIADEKLSIDDTIRAARILVVDDIAANVEMATGLLEVAGYTAVEGTTNSHHGLALAETDAFDLILLDMRMPALDGQEFIRRLRRRDLHRQPAIIVITAQTDEDTRRAALGGGARDFLVKPFKFWELQQRVYNALEIQVLYRQTREFNRALEWRVDERTRELQDTRLELIRRLATAAEFRDNETGQHVTRMSMLAHHLALKIGMSEAEAAQVRDAAPLHDVGKVGIPDAILLKRGRLDTAEWEIMKKHAEIGGEILAGSPFPLLDLARVIAITHHEKWDGSGYPKGLKREDIPIAGRIVAVCDVFDALTSARPHKSAWSVDAAVTFLLDKAGSHLDPMLVGVFHRELAAILDLSQRIRDAA